MLDDTRAEWNSFADEFDDWPDHGLGDPDVRAAWRDLLDQTMPTPPAEVADLGCGTGSLAVLLAEAGHVVRGLDLADRMLDRARAKASESHVAIEFDQGDAAHPPYAPGSFDVVLARHVLWTLPDPVDVLSRWFGLLRPGGRLVLIEGRWSTGAGLTAAECEALVRRHNGSVRVRPLVEPEFWGGEIDDERYMLVSPAR